MPRGGQIELISEEVQLLGPADEPWTRYPMAHDRSVAPGPSTRIGNSP